ncbi:MAG: 2-dehydropantoate 2-reductase N-terminal domain-containing protein, partial [Dehalococcoidia bacterium]
MNRNMAVLGTGAIGGSIGADLTRAGHDVLLIDQWPAHVEAMKAHGLRVTMPEEDIRVPVQAVHLCEVCTLHRQFDIVFLAAKSYDTRWMVEFIKPYLREHGVLVSTQNSLNDEWISPLIGYERDIGCALELSAEVFEPGRVKRNTDPAHTRFVVGELNGRLSSRVREVAQVLSAAGKTEVTTNIWGAKWTKLAVNTMLMAVDSIGGIGPWELVQDPKYVDFCIRLGRETVQVGAALGYALEPLFGLTAEDFLGSTDEALKTLLLKLA